MERSVIVGCVKREMEHLGSGDGWIVEDVEALGGGVRVGALGGGGGY